MDPELYELLQEGGAADEVAVVMRLLDPERPPPGTRVVARFGPVVTARVPRGAIPEVWRDPAVESLKAPRGLSADVEEPQPLWPGLEQPGIAQTLSGEATFTPNDARRPDGLEATGRGVVIGLVDWGCDFAHPDFRRADGRTRLLALWDQRPRGEPGAWPYGYGRVFTPEQLNAALQAPDPYAALDYHPADTDPGLGAHGTHTLGIAGGNGRGGGPVGVAPEAELVFVHMGAREGPGAVPLGNSVELLEGLDLIARVAAGRPCVVNLSLGRHAGEKTGRSLVEQALDAWVALAPGRAVVQSCGNYFERRTHADWTLRPGETRTFAVQVSPGDRSPNELDLWYPGRDRLGVEVRSAGGSLVARAARGERASAWRAGREVLRVYHRAFDPNNGDHQINVRFEVLPDVSAWEVTLTGEDVQDGRVHAWIERDSGCGSCQSRFAAQEADARTTLGTICTGYRTLAVGAYDPHREERPLGRFSSSGPTRDGRSKPDLIAPGVMILAPRSQGREGGGPLYTRMSGTSMAAPHVTGCVALMFGAAGETPLDIVQTRRLLLASCEAAPPDLDPARVGSGYLDPVRAVEAVRLGHVPARPDPPEVTPMPEVAPTPPAPPAPLAAGTPPPDTAGPETAGSQEAAPGEAEAFSSDVDPELTALEFAAADEEAGETWAGAFPGEDEEGAADAGSHALDGGGPELESLEAVGAALAGPVWEAVGGDGVAEVQAALASRLALVGAPGEAAGTRPDLAEVAGPCADVTVAPADRPRVLVRGAVHPAVREAQRKLSAFHLAQLVRGQPGLAGAPLREDCVLGTLTQGAVLDFQRQVFPGQPAEHDGKIGPHTWAQLDAVVLLPGPAPLAAVRVDALELLEGSLTRPLGWDEVIGLDVDRVHLRAAASGLPEAALPGEITVVVTSRPPNGDSGPATLGTPVTLRLPRTATLGTGRAEYRLSRTPGELGDFLAVETRRREVATLVRQPDHLGPGTSDRTFVGALGWAPRGRGTVPGSRAGRSGDPVGEVPDARQLFFAAGVEVLEVAALPLPGLRVEAPPARALIRSPADVVYYSGHGSSAHNCLLFEGVSREASCWLRPAELLAHWRRPLDLDLLILAGCSVLRVDFPLVGDPAGNGLAWARLLTGHGGPLAAILGYGGGAPADARGGDDIARAMGARLAGGSRDFARDWLEVNGAARAWNAVALDARGYWDFTAFHNIRGPRPLPAALPGGESLPAPDRAPEAPPSGEAGESADLPDAFFAGVQAVAAALGARPLHLLQVMMAESGLRPDAHNPRGHASGLIQFMPATLARLGWAAGDEAFRRLSAEAQLPYVERYYRPYRAAGLTSTARLYQATFLPATLAGGSDPATVLAARDGPSAQAYAANSGLDRRGDGTIRVADLTAAVERRCQGPRWEEARARLEGTAPPRPVPPLPGPVPPSPVPPGPVPPGPSSARPTLRAGSRGAAVGEAQGLLNAVHGRELAAGRPGLPGAPLTADGVFGPRTRAATVAFQRLAFPGASHEHDGVIGPRTWARLAEWARGGGAPTPPGPVPPAAPGTPWTQLKGDAARLTLEEYARWHPGGAARSETDPGMRAVLRGYWTQGAGLAGAAAEQAIDARLPWSAAFISWVMRQSGAGGLFRYASGHTVYCAAAKRNRQRADLTNPFWLYRVTERAPEPGDLICTGRQDSGVTFDNVDDGQFRASHGDVVVEVTPGRLGVIGGNVADTVGRKVVRTGADGRVLTDGAQRQYFAVLRLRTDPARE
ncbi:DUF2272 domain-containing protein [Deinococcus budaensis]|uniref:DUF2272 domain-containing protein n=1 Tax=Deinococcus budaensis TaxID=1665626 RepID=UPI0035F305EB